MKFSKHFLLIALVLILLGGSLAVDASAADLGGIKTGVAFITADSLRLRSSPSTQSQTLAYGGRNEVVVVTGKQGDWYQVLYNLQPGYMHGRYLRFMQTENVELGYGRVNYASVNMRTGPGTSYTAIAQSKQGQNAYIIGINQGWYKVIWNDRICYIRSDYLTLTEAPYENHASERSPLFFRLGKTTGRPVSAVALKNSPNYIPQTGSNRADQIIATARQYIGVPYVWGGTSPSGFDCSGLVQYVFAKHGVQLNRTTVTQYQQGSYVSKANLQKGDLVFFQNTYTTGISHVGIYIGDGQFIHASSSKGVMISALSNSYWASHYYGARRVL